MGMTQTFSLSQQMQNYQYEIEEALDRLLSLRECPQREGIEAMRYSLLAGGKRIRAILTLEFGHALWGGG